MRCYVWHTPKANIATICSAVKYRTAGLFGGCVWGQLSLADKGVAMGGTDTSDLIRAQIALSQKKSMAAGLLLTFFFGPLGMLYATVLGGIIMIVVSIVVAIFTLGFGLIVTQLICLVWAALAIKAQNQKIDLAVVGETTRRESAPPTAAA